METFVMFIRKTTALACVTASLLASTARASDIPQPLDRASAVEIAVARSQTQSAARATARAARAMGDAEGRLPDPEVLAEAWQVPFSRPLALGDGSMLSVTVRQSFPAPGVRSARAEAREAEARVAETAATDRRRGVERDAGHAFVDLQAAEERHASHVAHRDVAARIVAIARARLGSGGGRLTDVAVAEVERTRLDADVALESARVDRARAKLNGLLRRDLDAPLATTPPGVPETVELDVARVAQLAEANRPELALLRARRQAETSAAHAAQKEAALPTFTVGAGYYAPTATMPQHGYGVSLGATLPWVWGSAGARARASGAQADASSEELGEASNQVRTEAAAALADVKAAARRLAVLRSRAKVAAEASFDAAVAAYQSGQGDASALFRAEKDVVEIDVAVVEARAMLAHALVDLDWAVGAAVARAPLSARAMGGLHGEGGVE